MVFNCDCMLFKSKNKANLYQIQNFTLFKKTVFFIKSFEKIAKNRSTKGTVPPCRSLHLQLKTGISTCNKKQPFWLQLYFFPHFFLSVFNCGWKVFTCDCIGFVKTLQIPTPIEGEGGGDKTNLSNSTFFAWKPWDSDPNPRMELWSNIS